PTVTNTPTATGTPTGTDTPTMTGTPTSTPTITPIPCTSNLAAAANGGSIASYSSNYGGGWDVAGLIDGDLNVGWSGDGGQTTNQYIIVRLPAGNTYTIDHVQIDPAATGGDGLANSMRDFEIRVSTTDTNTLSFTTVITGTTPQQNALFRYDFAPVQAKYVMLFILNNYGDNYAEAAEFEVYAACGTPIATPIGTSTPTSTPTRTPGTLLVGHVTWQGPPAQPHAAQAQPISVTLRLQSGGPDNEYTSLTTDAGGFFTVPLSLSSGSYRWRVKGPTHLATSGLVTLTSGSTSNVEMGLQPAGDCNNTNNVDSSDFTILKGTFGKSVGQIGYDGRADFTGDSVVSASDFNLLRGNFGIGGAPPIGPAGNQ
ncbi:MAG: discoidin domain-containing protein, partial [Chloroflexia bacterium]